uniref:Serine-threonine kinase n=1 Tax=Bodo saltans TaxID=75058 RepID=B6DTE1_BODSA|nr:serine-threonine kinase [Bodo saltans]
MFEDDYLDRPPSSSSPAGSQLLEQPHHQPFMLKDAATQKYLLYGRYLMIRQLGKGTYSKVVLAKDLLASSSSRGDGIGDVVAIKIFRGQRNYDDAFDDECSILEAISSSHSVASTTTKVFADERQRCNSADEETLDDGLLVGSMSFSKILAAVKHRVHRAIIFPALGMSLLDILQHRKAYFRHRKDEDPPSPFAQQRQTTDSSAPYEKFRKGGLPLFVVRSIGYQLFAFLHYIQSKGVVHTDLKPENILLAQKKILMSRPLGPLPVTSSIKVIDFGSAEFTASFKNQTSSGTRISYNTIQTRHYRAPEVVFGSGWSYPADVWSVGLILWELLKGDCVFMTHDDKEHLAMMQRFLGSPSRADGGFFSIFRRGDKTEEFVSRRHHSSGTLRWPTEETSSRDLKYLNAIVPLCREFKDHSSDDEFCDFVSLIGKVLEWDPNRRLTAADALSHPFFASS